MGLMKKPFREACRGTIEISGGIRSGFAKLPGTNNVKVNFTCGYGERGYRFSLYIVDDPTNPVVVVKDSIIDGSSVVCPYIEDTNYKAEIITLGNEKLNNTASTTPAEPTWTTLVPATIVPPGDLTAWFTNNPITTGKDVEVAYELEAGGEYTIPGQFGFWYKQCAIAWKQTEPCKK